MKKGNGLEDIMGEITFYPNQAKQIFAMKPDGTFERLWKGEWNKCRGFIDKKAPDHYCIEFYSTENPGYLRYYFKPGKKLNKIKKMKNIWIDNPILNRTGLGLKVWGEVEDPNLLRRRLEQKADRSTFKEDEKERILKVVEDFLNEVKESFQ